MTQILGHLGVHAEEDLEMKLGEDAWWCGAVFGLVWSSISLNCSGNNAPRVSNRKGVFIHRCRLLYAGIQETNP